MDPNWGNYWATSRKQGRTWFVLKRGTVLGLIMFALLIMIPRLFKMVEATAMPVMGFIVFMLIGYGFGALLWWANERSYLKLLETETETQTEKSNDD